MFAIVEAARPAIGRVIVGYGRARHICRRIDGRVYLLTHMSQLPTLSDGIYRRNVRSISRSEARHDESISGATRSRSRDVEVRINSVRGNTVPPL